MTINSSKMGSLCGQLVNIVIDKNTDPITGFLLKSFIDLLKEEQETLDQKMDKLIGSYFKSGTSYLQDAIQVNRERQQKWIEAALDEFRKASTLENGLMAAKATFAVGVCYIMLNERKLALKWFEQAYQGGHNMEEKLIKKSTLNKMDAATIISLPFTTLYGAAWLGYRKHQRDKAHKLVLALRDFLIFVNGVLNAYQSKLDTLQTSEQREQNYMQLIGFLSNNSTPLAGPSPALRTNAAAPMIPPPPSHLYANVGATMATPLSTPPLYAGGPKIAPPPPPLALQSRPQYYEGPTVLAELPAWGYLHFSTGRQIPLTGSRVVVGRLYNQAGSQSDVDLASLPETNSVSHIHAIIELANGTCTITDRKSLNGTFVNNQRLTPDCPLAINNGDALSFGHVTCTFRRVY